MTIVRMYFILLSMLYNGMVVCQITAFSVKKKKQIEKYGYIENLAVHSVVFGDEGQGKRKQEVDVVVSNAYDINDQLDDVLEKRRDAYRKRGQICGYTIQAYKGSSRGMALKLRQKILTINPNYKPKMRFVQPFFEVLVGFFFEQIEGYQMYFTVRKYIPLAIMRPCLFSQEAYQQYREKSCSMGSELLRGV